jgi:hypothetical protein
MKTFGSDKYTWCPESFQKKNISSTSDNVKYFCTAVAGTQGQDWVTTYSYNIVLSPTNTTERIAYVECDYVI